MDYEVILGLEVHAELSTKSKIYCSCTTEFGGEQNSHTCPICTGMPGVLPVLNEKVVEFAIKMGIATNCEIARFSKQDRKNYFYPDLPKAYQTSQFDLPLCKNGKIDIEVNGETKQIGITRIHIEEDAGKLLHDNYTGQTLVDFNRCGVPLIEIVSEPDMRTAEEAVAYVQKLKSTLEYLEICDCKMQEGSLRCDVNLSVRKKGENGFRTRTETKNLNSFKSIQRAIEFEINRQIEEYEKGNDIYQETRRWDDDKGIGYAMRSKEDAHDYRYFPEPDLAPIVITEAYIESIKKEIPEMPDKKKVRYITEYNLPEYDSNLITSSKELSNLFEEAANICKNPKAVSNWIMGDLLRLVREKDIEISNIKFNSSKLASLISLIDKGTISSAIAKKVFEDMFETGNDPENIVKEKGLVQISDASAIREMVINVLKANTQSVEDFKAGKDRALGFIVGQVMKEAKGKANPGIVNKLVTEEINKM